MLLEQEANNFRWHLEQNGLIHKGSNQLPTFPTNQQYWDRVGHISVNFHKGKSTQREEATTE